MSNHISQAKHEMRSDVMKCILKRLIIGHSLAEISKNEYLYPKLKESFNQTDTPIFIIYGNRNYFNSR